MGRNALPANQIQMNTRGKASGSSNVRSDSENNRILFLEKAISRLERKIDAINSRIKTVKTVTKDRKGNTIIVINK